MHSFTVIYPGLLTIISNVCTKDSTNDSICEYNASVADNWHVNNGGSKMLCWPCEVGLALTITRTDSKAVRVTVQQSHSSRPAVFPLSNNCPVKMIKRVES